MESILIKLSGNFFCDNQGFNAERLKSLSNQIKELSTHFKIGLVLGGGNLFRALKQGKQLGMRQPNADAVGMLATVMNGLILQDAMQQVNLDPVLLSSFSIDSMVSRICQNSIDSALNNNKIIIFVGGTGNPFFTTDTNAILRALQIGSKQVLKATKVDGIYQEDPMINSSAKKFKTISYEQVIKSNLKIIDQTAIALARDNSIQIRVFNIFEKNALLTAVKNTDFGSTIK
jgi:uridylate kinase